MEKIPLANQAPMAVPGYASARTSSLPDQERIQERVKQRQRQLWRQIWLIIIIASAWVLGFLFVVFPFLVQRTGQINSEKYVPNEQIIRPQMPLINAPPAHTSEQILKMAGFGTPDTKVQFIVNDERPANYLSSIGINGEFSVTISLREGENKISAYSFDEAGQESASTKVYLVTLDQSIPEINLLEPTHEQEIVGKDKQNLLVKGQTEPDAKVLVNSVAGYADGEGYFEILYPLRDGDNELKIVTTDRAENQAEQVIRVTFRP